MLLTISTTHQPATDLGYLLVKHPDRSHEFRIGSGRAHVFFPVAREDLCTAALLLEVDPLALKDTHGGGQFSLSGFVNDRPYAASSLLSGAMSQVLRTALRGVSKDRPDLAATPIPLELGIPAVRCHGGAELVGALFEPLGWQVAATPIPLDEPWGESQYLDLTLIGTLRLTDALNQVYVLLPVLDDAKHYWVAPDEIDKLLRAGTGWLAAHPQRWLIVQRYLAHRRSLTNEALARLLEEEAAAVSTEPAVANRSAEEETGLPTAARRGPLAVQRRAATRAVLERAGATRVLDLGCGAGALLCDLVGDRRYTEIVGVDVSSAALDVAARRLKLDRLPERQRDRIRLFQGSLTYRDDRLKGYDAAVLMEVIEHIDPPRLPAMADGVFGHARPATVVLTTPNIEYNARYEGLAAGESRPPRLRHHDHRFEWDRAEFAAWTSRVANAYGYTVVVDGIGEPDETAGPPTQIAVFTLAAEQEK